MAAGAPCLLSGAGSRGSDGGAMRDVVSGLILAAALPCGAAQAAPSQERQREVWDDVGRAARKGPVDVALDGQAVLHLPDGEVFVPQPQADRLLDLMGGPGGDPGLLGVILPRDPRATWIMPVRFAASGFIKDDEAKTWAADDLLAGVRGRTDAQNRAREKKGIAPLEIVGWALAPRYDAARRRLAWAVSSRAVGAGAERADVDYNACALGRDGYFSFGMTVDLSDLPKLGPIAERQLAALEFNPGKRYEDFDGKAGRVAEHGLAAVVVGGAARQAGVAAPAGA
ncbi:MAG: DUF2167 domain-containing protein, partial [Burkholderiaceae bacterium]